MDNILTNIVSELIDIKDKQPESGSSVLALTVGGKLCEVVWTSNSHKYYDAWCVYPKIPKSVKERQVERFKN